MLQHKYSTQHKCKRKPTWNNKENQHIQHNVPTNQMHGATQRLEIKTSMLQSEDKTKQACCNSNIAQHIHGIIKKKSAVQYKVKI